MAMWYWSMAILFWQLSIDHIVNGQCKRCGFAKTRLRHPSLPFNGLPYPTRTICRRVRTYVRTLGQSRDNQKKRGWPYSMSMGLFPTRASRAREPRYNLKRPFPLATDLCSRYGLYRRSLSPPQCYLFRKRTFFGTSKGFKKWNHM